jgi:hypothetical protein
MRRLPIAVYVESLREQVRRLEELVRDLERHEQITAGEYLYSQMTLQGVIKSLRELEQVSSPRGLDEGMRAK